MDIIFTNRIRFEYKDIVEKLFFFNKNQNKFYSKIVNAVENYGHPNINIDDGYITISLDKFAFSETLFLSNGPKLFGIIIYIINKEQLNIIHIALDIDYINCANIDLLFIYFSILKKIRLIAKEDVKIKKIKMPYIETNIRCNSK